MYGDEEEVVVHPAFDDYFAVFVAVFDGVVEDVGDYLFEFFGVGVEVVVFVAEAELYLVVELDVDVHLPRDDGEGVYYSLDELSDVDFLDVGEYFAGFDFGGGEYVFELEVEIEGLVVDEGDHRDDFFPVLFFDGEYGFGESEDGCEGVDDFVGDVGYEVALEGFGVLESFAHGLVFGEQVGVFFLGLLFLFESGREFFEELPVGDVVVHIPGLLDSFEDCGFYVCEGDVHV